MPGSTTPKEKAYPEKNLRFYFCFRLVQKFSRMRARQSYRFLRARCATLSLCLLVALTAHTLAQSAPTNFTASKDLLLSTKTPLGEATVTIPAGATITNYEMQGEQVKIRQGAFTAVVALADLQTPPAPAPSPETSPTPTPEATPASTPTPEPEPAATAAPDPSPASSAAAPNALPDWLMPAVFGTLVAYALFATIALLRPRGGRKSTATVRDRNTKDAPVVALPSQSKAKPAVMAAGGRAIACPLCGKNIPLEKVSQGRNSCPSCQGTFVGE